MCTVDGHGHLNQPKPLYLRYSEIVQEEDKKLSENHLKSTDGVLVFVSPGVALPFPRSSIKHRLVYSLLPWQYCLRSQSQT
jgi:hypothetical protein